jgi:RNA recognition motif-containing protein
LQFGKVLEVKYSRALKQAEVRFSSRDYLLKAIEHTNGKQLGDSKIGVREKNP